MSFVMGVFSTFLMLAGIVLIMRPAIVFNILDQNSSNLGLYVAAIAVRLLLGGALIHLSNISKYPSTLLIIGWVSIFAAAILTIIGWGRFKKLMSWALSAAKPFSGIAGVLSIGSGVFLIYALF